MGGVVCGSAGEETRALGSAAGSDRRYDVPAGEDFDPVAREYSPYFRRGA